MTDILFTEYITDFPTENITLCNIGLSYQSKCIFFFNYDHMEQMSYTHNKFIFAIEKDHFITLDFSSTDTNKLNIIYNDDVDTKIINNTFELYDTICRIKNKLL